MAQKYRVGRVYNRYEEWRARARETERMKKAKCKSRPLFFVEPKVKIIYLSVSLQSRNSEILKHRKRSVSEKDDFWKKIKVKLHSIYRTSVPSLLNFIKESVSDWFLRRKRSQASFTVNETCKSTAVENNQLSRDVNIWKRYSVTVYSV